MRKFDRVIIEARKNTEEESNEFKMPQRATDRSAGYDFYNNYNKDIIVSAKSKFIYWTNIKYISDDMRDVLIIVPRSSLGIKKGMSLANTVCVIDVDYASNISNDGNIGICIQNNSDEDLIIPQGQAFAQGIITHYIIIDNDIPVKKARVGGFGSTNS